LGVKYEELPLEKIEDPHLRKFYEWLGEKGTNFLQHHAVVSCTSYKDENFRSEYSLTSGFAANIDEVKRCYPELLTFKQWVEKNRNQLGVQA
jgi:hypothetical protein